MIIKGESSEINVSILKRSNSAAEDFWDGNWLDAKIEMHVRGFNCVYGTSLRVDDFERFYEDVLALNSGTKQNAEFMTMEEGFYLHLQVEPNGVVICRGKAKDDLGNSMEFKFESDLMLIEYLIEEVKMILKAYPLRSN